MHDANQSPERTIDRVFRKSRRRLSRPADAKLAQLLSAYPENENVKVLNGVTMIPVPPEDARALGLRVPDESNATGSSAHLSTSKSLKKRSNDDNNNDGSIEWRDVKRCQNANARREERSRKLAKHPKKERKAQRTTVAMDKLCSLQARLERGLRSISNKTKTRPKVRADATKDLDSPRSRNDPSCSREDKRRREPSSVSTKQLFSLTESWSSDSVVSRSDNCACCHGQEHPCPLHQLL